MQESLSQSNQLQRIQRYMLILMLVWSVVVISSLAFNLHQSEQAMYQRIQAEAEAIHSMDIEYRNWIIGHGGVYVPVSEGTPPSPNLRHVPERDIITPSGKKLTLLNSSYAMRQVHELMDEHGSGLRGHIASIRPINPGNQADGWEAIALKAFERGKKELTTIEKMPDGHTYFRFMKPMVTEESCLKCHGNFGDKVGDIRGGISVSIPIDMPLKDEKAASNSLMLGHGAIWLLGLLGLFIGGRRQQGAIVSVIKSEAELKLMANAIAHAIYGQDVQGRCTFANAACVEMLGYHDESELLGKDIHALAHHSHADGSPYPSSECPTHRCIREEKTFHEDEEVLWRRDGSSFPAVYWSYPIVRNGQCLGAVVTFMDITHQKQIGDELKRSQQLLNSIVEHIPAMVFLKRAEDLRFELFNAAGEKLLGYTREDLLGKNDYDLFPKEQADFFTTKDREVLDSHQMLKVPEETIKASDGTEKWLQTFKVGLYDEQDQPAHLLGISLDISERKRAEGQLKESRGNLAEAQRIAHMGSWELDLLSQQLYWSDEIYRIFEIDPEHFSASYEAFLEAIHPDDRVMVDKAYNDSLTNRTPYEIEHRLLMRDGRIKYVFERCETRYDDAGKAILSTGTVQDITERKQAELALSHANRALQTLSTVNRELVHADHEASLLQAICKTIVRQDEYRLAWVGYVQHDDAKSIQLMACAGDQADDVLANIHASWDANANGTGPDGKAVRNAGTELSRDIARDSQFPAWKKDLLEHGCVSAIALPLMHADEVFGILNVYAGQKDAFKAQEVALLEEMAGDLAFGISTLRLRAERDKALEMDELHLAQLRQNLDGTVMAISKAVEARDPYTAGHQRRVAELAVAIGRQMGMDEDTLNGIRIGATIHDIGKIQVPAELLSKPSGLSTLEYQMMQQHPKVGYEILRDIHFPWPVADIAYQHHERMDGSGYPLGLKGEKICMEARIVAVADVVEAMSSHRPYRPGKGIDVALEEVRANRGSLFDEGVVDACLKVFAEGFVLQP